MILTKNFFRDEFKCKCGCDTCNLDPRLVYTLQDLRDRLRQPVHVASGCRCQAHNEAVGGAPASYHLADSARATLAADIYVDGYTTFALMKYIVSWDRCIYFRGLGVYPDTNNQIVHIDTRRDKIARWICDNGKYRTVNKF